MIVQTETKLRLQTDPMVPVQTRITRLAWETDDTYSITLDMNDRNYAFRPGQFNMLYVFGVGEAAISISSDPSLSRSVTHTIHNVGSVTSALSHCKRSDVVGVRGPFGSGWPIDAALGRDVCIVAGGIGLAPLRPLLYSLFRKRKQFGRIVLLYGSRSPLDLLYRVELEDWGKRHNIEVLVTVDRGDPSWKGHIGVVTTLFSYIKIDPRATIAYVCGPETMMKFTLGTLTTMGLPGDQIYLSMERNMKCAVGYCGHCQYGPHFICKDGPVFALPRVKNLLDIKEL